MDKKKIYSIIALFLIILIVPGMHAQSSIVSKFEKVTDTYAPTLKISFHSWGEGRSEKLNLDQYFPIKRDQNSRYVYLAPPEISVSIDQTTGVASLTSFRDWTGTKEIIFALTDVYSLETTISNLQKYRDIITQQRAPVRLKEEFEDLPAYQIFEKILDDLESEAGKASSPKIEVSKIDNNIKISVGKDINLELDLKTLTEENIPTLKPNIGINIQPEKESAQPEEQGLSIFIFIPLILIGIVLGIMGIFYIKNNKEKLKKHFKKEKQKPTVYNKIIEQKKELSFINNRLDQQPIKESENEVFKIIKSFFNSVTPEEYQFSYSEIKKEHFEKELSNALKEKLCRFSREISDIRFSGKEIAKPELKNIVKQTQQLISSAADEERLIIADKEHEKLKKTFPVKTIKYILDSFTSGKREFRASKIKEGIDVKKKTEGILHRLGIIKTLAEKELKRKRKYLQKLKRLKDKGREKELERKKEEEKKRRKELLKLKEKQQEEHLKWLEAQRKIRESERIREEKIKRRLERVRAIRDFFHYKFGLFRTVKDLEKKLEEKRKKRLEKEKKQKAKRQVLKKSILGFLHFLRLYKTPTEKHEKELILKREERLEKQHEERKKEARKQAVLSFLHKLKLYRTREEIEREKERRLRKLREKQRKKEEEYRKKELEEEHKRKLKQNEKLRKLEEKKRKQHLKLLEKTKTARKKELEKERREENLQRKKKEVKRFLHDKLGLFKTLEEKESEREANYRDKLRKQRIKEEKKLQELKRKQEEKLRKQKISENKRELKLQAKRKEEDIKKKEKVQKIERELQKKQEAKRKNEIAKEERKRKLKAFLHDKLGLLKTREEIQKSKLERKEHLVGLEHKLEDTILKSLASRLERKNLTPEQEIKVLMQMGEEALRKGNSEKSVEIQKKINKLYGKIRKQKPQHPSLILNRLKNNLESARDYVFSSSSKLDSLSPFIKKLNETIRSSMKPKIESARLDQINYLISKAEIELRRNRKDDAKEYYKRALYLYRSLNQASKKIALPTLLKVKNEITSTAIVSSLEKAFSAIHTGQIKKAEKLYKNIDINFLNLPTHEREKIYDKKEELYQSIKEQKESKPTSQNITKLKQPIIQAIKSLFEKEKKQKFYPLTDMEYQFKSEKQPSMIKEEKSTQPVYTKKESLMDFVLARRPKFTSIKTEIQNKRFNQTLTKKLLGHIKAAEAHLERKNHEKAHHNYKAAISIFKDLHLRPEIRDNIYNNLAGLKEKILHTSIHNFMKKTKESVEKEEIEEAKKFHGSLEGIYSHLQRKKENEQKTIPDLLFLERKLDEAFSMLKKGDKNNAMHLYNQINNQYSNLKPEEKKEMYSRLITLYSELIKK